MLAHVQWAFELSFGNGQSYVQWTFRYIHWTFALVLDMYVYTTRKYMHACTQKPSLADKTIVFSEHEVFKVVVIVTR